MARVPYAEEGDVPEEYRELLSSALQERPINAYRAFGNNPEVLFGIRELLAALWSDTGLTVREREQVILVVARVMEAEYEWHSHARIALGIDVPNDDVLTRREVSAISDGDYGEFDETEQLLIEYTRAVLDGTVDNELHARMAAEYDDSTLIGTCVLAGTYAMVALVFDAIDIDLDDAFSGWNLENI